MNIKEKFESDSRIVKIRHYKDGFVANSYRWPCPGKGIEYFRDGSGLPFEYDRKRSGGKGSEYVCLSEKGGILK